MYKNRQYSKEKFVYFYTSSNLFIQKLIGIDYIQYIHDGMSVHTEEIVIDIIISLYLYEYSNMTKYSFSLSSLTCMMRIEISNKNTAE